MTFSKDEKEILAKKLRSRVRLPEIVYLEVVNFYNISEKNWRVIFLLDTIFINTFFLSFSCLYLVEINRIK